MARPKWRTILAYVLAAFFLVGGVGNLFIPEGLAADYLRWGYPDWFHFVTGTLELSAAILLAFKRTRVWGALLAALIMLAAFGTVTVRGEYLHGLAPLVVLAVSLTVLVQSFNRRFSS